MAVDDKQTFIADLARNHGARLRQFLARKLRHCDQDVPDLVQEIYLRLMRVRRHDAIRSPQAYLYTVAFHVIYQHKLNLAAVPDAVDVLDALTDSEEHAQSDPATQLDARQRLSEMEQVLRQLPPVVHAAFVLNRYYGCTQEEIAEQLNTSRGMVRKHLAKAITHIRLHAERKEKQK